MQPTKMLQKSKQMLQESKKMLHKPQRLPAPSRKRRDAQQQQQQRRNSCQQQRSSRKQQRSSCHHQSQQQWQEDSDEPAAAPRASWGRNAAACRAARRTALCAGVVGSGNVLKGGNYFQVLYISEYTLLLGVPKSIYEYPIN